MHDAYPTNIGPAIADFGDQSFEPRQQMLLVRLVCKACHVWSAARVVARRAAEEDHGSAVGLHRPSIRLFDQWLGLGDGEPGIAVWPCG